MNYLLDTHAFLWSLTDKSTLSSTVRKTLENPDNSIFVSAITFWEISLKFSIGKLKLEGIDPSELTKQALLSGFQLLSLSAEESAGYYNLNLTDHKDPFDRMLIWQAIQQNLIFISKDRKFDKYTTAGLKTLW